VSIIEIDLTELGSPAERVLTLAQGRMLAASGVVTVAQSLDRPGWWLVGGNEEAVHHTVRGAGVEIICHALDLNCPPQILLTEAGDLAWQVAIID
jgi:hypothetical protein